MHFTTPAEVTLHRESVAMASPAVAAAHARIEEAIFEGRRPIRIAIELVGDKAAQAFLRRRYESAGWSWVYNCDPCDGDFIELHEVAP